MTRSKMDAALAAHNELLRQAEKFYNEHQDEIEGALAAREQDHILREMPKRLAEGLVVWCRDGAVCQYSTPCRQLDCAYKTAKSDVVNGTASCLRFQLTEPSIVWDDARQVAPPGSVDLSADLDS